MSFLIRRMHLRLSAALVASVVATLATVALVPAAAQAQTVWAVGDGAVPEQTDDAVAARIEREGIDRLLYLGDVYETGTAAEFKRNYHPSFGRFKQITSPTPGNHEWRNRRVGYDPYWGSLAPRTGGGHYYSFDYAGWHFVSLNSHEDSSSGSPQVAWLRRDLARYDGDCTIAFWHRPRYSAGGHGYAEDTEPFWRALQGRAVVALAGHEHNYQRLRAERGILPLIAGTGGRKLSGVNTSHHRLVAYDVRHHGAVRMRLSSGRLRYEFVTTGGAVTDRGSLSCRPHSSAAGDPPRPTVTIRTPVSGRAYSRRLRRFSGRSSRATSAPRLTLVRRLGRGRCVAFDGRRFRRASCRTRRSFRARGSARWSYRLPARLARGSYKLAARVTAEDGARGIDVARFRIR